MAADGAPILPTVNAFLNGTATVLLATGFVAIRSGRRRIHGLCMTSAILVSAVFLIGYVSDKVIRGGVHTPFAGEGLWRPVYYTMLLTHIVAAAVILPLVLRTWYLARKERFEHHRKWARVTWPLWMYVSVTGVLVYLFLYRWF